MRVRMAGTVLGFTMVLSLAGCVVVVHDDDHDGYSSFSSWDSSPRIGVELAGVAEATAMQAGADPSRSCIITRVYAGSPAERAGLMRYDVVTGIDGRDYASESALREAIRGRKAGETVNLTVVRGGKVQEIAVVVEERG